MPDRLDAAFGLDAVFGALADPTRRHMVERLVAGGPETATALARDLPISRQAVVKHLQSLSDAGLVDAARQGREVKYAIRPEPFSDAIEWMMRAGAQWDRRLERLSHVLGQKVRDVAGAGEER
jgi:ArsR family transcriptional regulator, cadmium/lead-responsive transcriptional repressor